MSNDYASIVTSLDAAVLLVGTVQFAARIAKFVDHTAAGTTARRQKMGRLIENQRRGIEPTRSELLEARRRSPIVMMMRSFPLVAAGGIWATVCVVLISVQLKVLQWAGTANAGPNPELARRAFEVTAVSIIFLLVEGYMGGLVKAYNKGQELRRAYREQYTDEERAELQRKIRSALRPEAQPVTSTGED
ncbi:hypothetical protein ABT272_35765 [Streptomyces sp900105245]|uniref:Uncharacterized protein n=1 Tax=Streptomyces sp. 900105245 TaxID=3154379 RepID=A0ABV1UHK7_9ACTN